MNLHEVEREESRVLKQIRRAISKGIGNLTPEEERRWKTLKVRLHRLQRMRMRLAR